MPVTKTARRALRGSKNKAAVNKVIVGGLEIAVRLAKKTKISDNVLKAVSLADRAAKKGVIHKNKAARIKSQLSKLMPQTKKDSVKPAKKAAPKKK
jgi:small subunit ribosomal protein S20